MEIIIDKKVNSAAKKDILELNEKIKKFKNGEINEEKFKAFRLARGVYGQRQQGVQMLRIKLPFGKLTCEQLTRLADISDQYTNGKLHLTTRQNVQMHYIKLEDSPQIWNDLEAVGITTREACGNTVRNITAAAKAGIDPDEPFDVAPYVQEVFEYFLRNPVCQEMGRKIKMAFSSSEKDAAFAFLHDFGFIPRIKFQNNKELRGFKVLVGGGLGAQAMLAQTAYEFLPEDEIIPFIEAGIRVFDRYGEREKRFKARLKFLIDEKKGIGLNGFLKLVDEEKISLPFQHYHVDRNKIKQVEPPSDIINHSVNEIIEEDVNFEFWKKTNVFEQKQNEFYGVLIKVNLGNLKSEQTRLFAQIVKKYAADDVRITIEQGFLLRFVRAENLHHLYKELVAINLAGVGANTLADITACPGTDTCNLAVTNSTDVTLILEELILDEFKNLVTDNDISIKISGCMNSCGQHMVANIGFHGSSIKNKGLVIPALQVVIGGGVDKEGRGFIADKIIKLPSKRITHAVRFLLTDYEANGIEGEYFNDYYQRYGKMYFYNLLKPLADVNTLQQADYVDWGKEEAFVPEIGVGECAGVTLDVVGTIIQDAEEKLEKSREEKVNNSWARAIYYGYNTFVISAKALLLSEDFHCNTQIGIIKDFQTKFISNKKFDWPDNFEDSVLLINKNTPTEKFAEAYYEKAQLFLNKVKKYRSEQLTNSDDKIVIENFYKA